MNQHTEHLPKYVPAINYIIRTTKLLQEEIWIREWETKNVGRSATSNRGISDIECRVRTLFGAAKEEIFEGGMESEFSRGLVSLVKEYGKSAIGILARFIVYEQVNEETASEALRWLGQMDHPSSYNERLRLLEKCLRNSSARVRDAASLGLASLDDPHAIPRLKQAIQRETCAELREDMEQVLAQLEKTHQCHSY